MDPLIGTVVGDRYRIVERIGAGGMAVVYRGEHQLLRKGVAIKVLLPEVAVDKEMADRFEAEAVAAAKLDHPNCVGISDFGKTKGGQLYLVMELIDGQPLSTVCGAGQRIPWQRAVDIARQVLRGLARAHELGIVHRDLKPSNIMLVARSGGAETAKIIDFGIAKVIGESPVGPRVETRAGTVFGTADFIAPERLVGKPGEDPRSDLYAVGVLLYEMITGTRPFHDEDALTIVRRAIVEQPQPPTQRAPDAGIPATLEAAILKALAKEPDLRHASAREFLAALDADDLRTGTNPVVAAATRAHAVQLEAQAERTRKKWLVWGSVGGGALLVLIALIASSGGSGGAKASEPAPGVTDKDRKSARDAGGKEIVIADEPPDAGLPAPVAAEIDRLVKQAAEGETMEIRQSAADRLVAMGFKERVPRAAKLARDLHQAPTCEDRLGVLADLEKLKDPITLTSVRAAAARPDNGCLEARAKKLAAALSAKKSGGGTRTTGQSGGAGKKSGGGGHF
jgi:hypothetical protein